MKNKLKILPILLFLILFNCSNTNDVTYIIRSEYDGIGIETSLTENGHIRVTRVFPESPAEKAGLKVDDEILAISKNYHKLIYSNYYNYNYINNVLKSRKGTQINIIYVTADYKDSKKRILSVNTDTIKISKCYQEYLIDNRNLHLFFRQKDIDEIEKLSNQLGDKYYSIYLKYKHEFCGIEALKFSYLNWKNGRSFKKIIDSSNRIAFNDNVWGEISFFIYSAYCGNAKNEEEGIMQIKHILSRISSLKGKSELSYLIGLYYNNHEKYDLAREYFTKIVKINFHRSHIPVAKGYIYEIDNLKIGSVAPGINIKDINGKHFCLNDYRGKNIVLHFWSPKCGFSLISLDVLKNIYSVYKSKNLEIISIQVDGNLIKDNMREYSWKQANLNIFNNDSTTIIKDYNIWSYPTFYLIDNRGRLFDKRFSYSEIKNKIDRLIRNSNE